MPTRRQQIRATIEWLVMVFHSPCRKSICMKKKKRTFRNCTTTRVILVITSILYCDARPMSIFNTQNFDTGYREGSLWELVSDIGRPPTD